MVKAIFLPARRQWPLVMALFACLLLPDSAVAANRVVAVGDIHGEYDGLVEILREAALIDEENRWIGGDTTLVQTGDFTDRGAAVRQVLDLLMSLEEQAPEQGGQVIVLMGNHEAINLMGDYQDATPEILASFAGDDAEKRREKAWSEWVRWLNQLAKSRGGTAPGLSKEKKAQFMKEHPLGYFEYQQAMSPAGKYGAWILSRPIMVQIGDTAFMHAGISPEYASMSIEAINELHRREIETFIGDRELLIKKRIVPSFFNLYEINQALVYQSANPPVPEYANSSRSKMITRAAENLNRIQKILLEDSPLWYRGYTNLTDEELEVHLERLAESYGAHRFVVAHSPLATGKIHQRLDGRVFLIDTGMLSSYYRGRPSALEIQNGRFSALYTDGERQVLVEPEEDMVPASAAADNSAALWWVRALPANRGPASAGRVVLAAYPPQAEGDSRMHERVWRDPVGNPLPFETVEALEEFLATAEVVSQQNIPKGVTKPKKILLARDGVQAHAKFNYVDRTGQRERMADGTVEMYFMDSYKADMASYKLSLLLGMESVPPAVARNIDGQDGIVQLWVEGLNTYENWLEEGNTGTPASTYFERQLKDMHTFDLLIRNTDRNQGNIAWDQDTNLWLIDHTRSMARDPGLREPDKFKGCSRSLYQAMQSLDEKTVTAALTPYLGSYEIKALLKRRDRLIKLIDARIKKRGEDEVLFNYSDPPKGMVITYDESAA